MKNADNKHQLLQDVERLQPKEFNKKYLKFRDLYNIEKK